MKRAAGILAMVVMVLVVSALGASDVLAGAAGAPAGKTTGASVTATIVIDVTGAGLGDHPGKGLTSIRIQRSGSSAAALFTSGLISTWVVECNDVVGDTNGRFVGNLNGWVPQGILTALFGGTLANQAVITDTDYPACTDVLQDGAGGGTRHVLSFTAVIQFEK